jgi:dTDP-4-dehydrorhamnose reductase
MIALLGASGWIGQAFVEALQRRGRPFITLSRSKADYTQFPVLLDFLRARKPTFLINAAGYTGKPNVDACEVERADTLQGNSLFPAMVAHACMAAGIPWGHVSSGCIFSGAKIPENGSFRAEKDLTVPAMKELVRINPEKIRGYTEKDEPNFTFRQPPCSFYSGTKALGEEAVAGLGQNYIWRLRIPFDEIDNPRNYLTKVQNYSKVYENVNSLSHRGEFVQACLDLWELRAPFGIYNMTNPGWITTRQVIEMIERILRPDRKFEFWASDEEFYRVAAKTPRSNCVMDVSKLLATGAKFRPVTEALEDSLKRWASAER